MKLDLQHISKAYGKQSALRDINLSLDKGPIALLGTNGSGKTTLLRILATLEKPDSGTIQWSGIDYRKSAQLLRQKIGYLPQKLELPHNLTVHRLLYYLAQMRYVAARDVDDIISALTLEDFAHRRLSQLSGGQLRAVGIAQALLAKPEILLLDELGLGLDVIERERIFKRLAHYNGLIIFSTHIPEEAEQLAASLIILDNGRVCFCGSIPELITQATGHVYECAIPARQLPQTIIDWPVSRVMQHNNGYTHVRIITKPTYADAQLVLPTLEDAYLWVIRHYQ